MPGKKPTKLQMRQLGVLSPALSSWALRGRTEPLIIASAIDLYSSHGTSASPGLLRQWVPLKRASQVVQW